MPQARSGAVAPERLRIRIRNRLDADPSEVLDFTTASAAEIRVEGGPTWACTIDSVSSDEIAVVHVWAEGDIPTRCLLRLGVYLTTPAGPRRASVVNLEVT